MYAVGRLGSYITRGVYTVSGPFHPFGGAVDIVVVQQQDGSLKSSPWYVRFGKFQGVLKAKEKVVDINVNGVEADFHMYLDPRGEAYFLREAETGEIDVVLPLSSGEEGDVKARDSRPLKSKSLDCNFDSCDSVNDATQSRILGFVLGRKSVKDDSFLKEEDDSKVGRVMSLDRAEVAADLLEMKWSTDLLSQTKNKDCKEARKDDGATSGGRLEAGLVLREEHFVNNMESHLDNVTNCEISKEVEETNVANVVHEEHGGSFENSVTEEESSGIGLNESNKPETESEEPLKVIAESCREVASIEQERASAETESSTVAVSDKGTEEVDETDEIRPSLDSNGEFHERFVEEQFMFGDLDDMKSNNDHVDQETHSPSTSEVNHEGNASMDPNYVTDLSPQRSDHENFDGDTAPKGNIRRYPSNIDIVRSCKVTEEDIGRQAKSLPNMWSHFDEFDSDNFEDASYYSFDSKSRSSKWDTLRKDVSKIIKADLVKELKSSDSQSADTVSKDLNDDSVAEGDLSDIVDGTGGSWSLWPFRRSRSKKFSQKVEDCKKDSEADVGSEAEGEKEVCSPKANKMQTRALTPTSEQLASLNLTEGKNTVTFTFSTSVLGPQQVDARIYLWRWDTRIVISDVDGTITKSDVLGQFMPLVGRDWSHIGVTHLFSAIKENGYQMLFLSARAISQAYITRQFLFNLKQDGKALPDGPVVISPDGLFPSLFREVIRRAPHEFKIACLEDIKACFPSDRNPFYAGFGNRDTDEFSYLKVGIPKGKIFIINPKGEVVVNRCIDSKSYTSLHALVNGIFPPISVHEEEDYNSWNFWKLPPPTMD